LKDCEPSKPLAIPCKSRAGPTPFEPAMTNAEVISSKPAISPLHAIAGKACERSRENAVSIPLIKALGIRLE